MSKFARIIELPENNQVLLTLGFDEDGGYYTCKVTTDIDGVAASIELGFDTSEQSEDTLKNFTVEDAENHYNEMRKLILG